MTKKNFSKKQSLLRKYSPKYYDREDCESTEREEQDWVLENSESVEVEEEYSMQVVAHMPDLNGEESETAPRHLSRFERRRNFQLPKIPLEKIPVKKCAAGLAIVSVLGLIVWSFIPKSHDSQQVAVVSEESNASIFAQQPMSQSEPKTSAETSFGAMSGFFSDVAIVPQQSQPQQTFETTTFENTNTFEANRNFPPQQASPAPPVASPWDQPTTSADHNYMFHQSHQTASVPQQTVTQSFSLQNQDFSYQQPPQTSWNVPQNQATATSYPPQIQQQPMVYSNTPASDFQQNVPHQFGGNAAPSYYQSQQPQVTQATTMPNLPVQQGFQQPNFPITQDSANHYGVPQAQVPNVAMASQYSQNFDNAGNQQQQPFAAQPTTPQGQWVQNPYQQTPQNAYQQNGNLYRQPAAQNDTNTPIYQTVPPNTQNGLQQIPAGPARSYKDTAAGYDNSAAVLTQPTNEYPTTAQQPYPATTQPQATHYQQPQYYIR